MSRVEIKKRIKKVREHYLELEYKTAFILGEYFGWKNHKYEFETNRENYPDIFLRVLNGFDLTPEDIYIAEVGLDFSQIEFRTDRKTRLAIEYTFREFVKLPSTYLMEVDHTESSLEITCNDGYTIF